MRKAAKVTPQELKVLFEQEIAKKFDIDKFSFHRLDKIGKIFNDISKVEFSFENYFWTETEESDLYVGLLGYRQIGNLSFIGVEAGGDWEFPVFFIIYLDNNKVFRGYVPKDGNTWNFDTKKALGNDEESDDKFLRKWIKKNRPDIILPDYPLQDDEGDIMWDREKVIKDFTTRILVND